MGRSSRRFRRQRSRKSHVGSRGGLAAHFLTRLARHKPALSTDKLDAFETAHSDCWLKFCSARGYVSAKSVAIAARMESAVC